MKIPGKPDHLSMRFLNRWMRNITLFLLIFESPKTVQYRRRHHRPKFDPEISFQFSAVPRRVADPFSDEAHRRYRSFQHSLLVPFETRHLPLSPGFRTNQNGAL
jgi:hypothetical protein